MNEYISREQIFKKFLNEGDGYYSLSHLRDVIRSLPAADVQPIIETEDLATATEQFICKNCGIRVENFDKVILEEDNDGYIDKLFCEYIFKFCPECGAKVKGGDTE